MYYKLPRIFRTFSFVTLLLMLSCEPDEVIKEVTFTPGESTREESEEEFKTSGFIVSSFASTSAGNASFATYLESKPVGNLDLTQHKSFQLFNPIETYKNFSFGRQLNGERNGLSRFSIDKETNEIIEKTLVTTTNIQAVKVINNELALYTVSNTQKLFVFNPLTMEFIREIDMPNAKAIKEPNDQTNNYFEIIYRAQDNKVFLPLVTNNPNTPAFYDANDIYIEVVNLDTFSWESTATLTEATYPFTRGATNNIIDEMGNVYITCQGSYSLDGQAGPTAAKGSRPQIVKIPSGSTSFDTDYSFNPVDFLGFNFIVSQFVTGTVYGSNGIAYAAISAKADDPRILELLQLRASGQATQEDFNELRNLVINGANSRWAKLDLNAKTATVIEDIPFTAGFGFPYSYNYEGNLFFQTFNIEEGINGYYEYNPETNTSFNIFNVTAGGIVTQLVKLQE